MPYSIGERCLTIHPTALVATTQHKSIRRRVIDFGITLSQRMRKDPNDRFGEATYLDNLSMSSILEAIIPIIENEDTTQAFVSSLSEIVGPIEYDISDGFRFNSINLDPKHLYPSNFGTRNKRTETQELEMKIAGFSMTAVFESPEFQARISPYQCQPTEDSSSS